VADRERETERGAVAPVEAPEEDPRIHGEKHPIARMIGIGVVAAAIGTGITLLIDWFPDDADTAAGDIDTVYDVLLICSVPIFVLVMTIAIYSVVRFRARPGDMSDGPPIHGNTRLEVFWVTVPFILVSGLAIYGWIVLDDIEAKQQDELVVNVTGQQFTWSFDYPEAKVASTQLVLPKDRPIDFRIKTKDVIHSFWVPEFRLKSDAVPGLTTKIRLTPTRTGRYQVVCAELCGIGHATMRQLVRVVEEPAFEAWLRERRQAAGGQPAGGGQPGGGQPGGGGAGRQLFAEGGCASCHTLADADANGTVGPNLDELSRRDEAYVKQSIVNPNATVVQGFPRNVMPDDFGDRFSPEEVDALVKYLLRVSGGNGR
jgi:cytochrome c oxidase subunit 2